MIDDPHPAQYCPTHVDAVDWAVVRGVVLEATALATSSPSSAIRYLTHAAPFAAWARRQGLPLVAAGVFDADLVERYVAVGMPAAKESTRATRRGILRRLSAHVQAAHQGQLPTPEPIAYRRVRPPYSDDQITGYLRLAAAQPTAGRRRAVSAVIALGAGCGLDSRDMLCVRGADVRPIEGRTDVTVAGGSRPRVVTALAAFEGELARLSCQAESGLLIGGTTQTGHNVTSKALGRLVRDNALPPLVVSRLRSTWLTKQLDLRTPLPVLMAAAGLQTARPLEDLLSYAAPVMDADRAAWLRGSG